MGIGMVRVLALCLATAVAAMGAPQAVTPVEQGTVRATIAELIAQPWKYHQKTVRVSGVVRYVFAGRGSRMRLGPDRERQNLIDIGSEGPGAIWLPLYRYNWADVELTAVFDGDCVIPRPDEKITVCSDGGEHGYLIPKAVRVIGYVEPVIESNRTIDLIEINPTSPRAAGISAFVRALAHAIASNSIDGLVALNAPVMDPMTPKQMADDRAWTRDLFFSSDMRIHNVMSPEPGRDYRLYREDGYTLRSDEDYLCFCKQPSCDGRWPRPGEIFNANPTRPWVCYRITNIDGRWYLE
jgi:hypothetical protein